jgi:hypothetical protein
LHFHKKFQKTLFKNSFVWKKFFWAKGHVVLF